MKITSDYSIVECENCGSKQLLFRPSEQDIENSQNEECCDNPDRWDVDFDTEHYLLAIEDALESANWHSQSDVPRSIVHRLAKQDFEDYEIRKIARSVAEAFYAAI